MDSVRRREEDSRVYFPTPTEVVIDPSSPQMEEAWQGLLDLAEKASEGWVLVGGQMVLVRSLARGVIPGRLSNDGDIVMDVRGIKNAPEQVISALREAGFVPIGGDHLGRQHRWVKDDAQIDVLQPRFLGFRTEERIRRAGATTIPAPGTQHAINRSEVVRVMMNDRHVLMRCPSLLGALVAKAAAYSEIMDDRQRNRHLYDIAELAPLMTRDELDSEAPLSKTEHARLVIALKALELQTKSAIFTRAYPDLNRRITALRRIIEQKGRLLG